MSAAAFPRRVTDRIILYGAIAGALAAILTALNWTGKTYSMFSEVLTQEPETAAKVERLERWQAIQDERTYEIEWWMSEVGKKLGVPAPPPRHTRRNQ